MFFAELGMSSLVSDLLEQLKAQTDPRTRGFPFIGNPAMVMSLIAGYLYVIKVWGPRWMEDRKPFDLKGVIMAYNALMVALNIFFFYKFLTHSYLGGGYSWVCQGIDFHDPKSLPIVTYCWWYFMVRILDFADTLFFLLRKKYSHISFLHVVLKVILVFVLVVEIEVALEVVLDAVFDAVFDVVAPRIHEAEVRKHHICAEATEQLSV